MSTQAGGTALAESADRLGQTIDLDALAQAQIETQETAQGTVELAQKPLPDGTQALALSLDGSGQVALRLEQPISVSPTVHAANLWVTTSQIGVEVVLLLDDEKELAFSAQPDPEWQFLHRFLPGGNHQLVGLALRGDFTAAEGPLLVGGLNFEETSTTNLAALPTSAPAEMGAAYPLTAPAPEEVQTSIEKDGISFVLESRSVSSVVRFIYTPIDGTLADIELEINNAEAIHPAEEGGLTVHMGGQHWDAAEDEGIERHFVSCEQVGECVEARWQWKCGDELADFLYRMRLDGKTLLVDLEGGNGKATGFDFGYVAGALHPRAIQVPFLNLGEGHPNILCTSGVFISAFVDWQVSNASALYAPQTDGQLRLNGGCRYLAAVGGRRPALRERLAFTVSRSFEEVLPKVPARTQGRDLDALRDRVWYNLPELPPSEEAYIEVYEQLRALRQLGLERLLVNHPPSTWNDVGTPQALAQDGAASKGGSDALEEYLEAVQDLGFLCTLYADYHNLLPASPQWNSAWVARRHDGDLAPSAAGGFSLKPGYALTQAPEHAAHLRQRYGVAGLCMGEHTAKPPWDRLDQAEPNGYNAILYAEQTLLERLGAAGLTIGMGGSHWLYAGLLHGHLARMAGEQPAQQPLLVDFALRHLHSRQIDAGLGSIEQFHGAPLEETQRHAASPVLDRYLAATLAYGHACVLPDPVRWGLPAAAKAYHMLQGLQPYYLGVPVTQIQYHHEGHFLDTTEALIAGACQHSQLSIAYQSGLQLYVNGADQQEWRVTVDEAEYTLPPASFLAHAPDGALVFSADRGEGRIDMARTGETLYFDTRGQHLDMGPVAMSGAALVRHKNWQIDVLPFEHEGQIVVVPGYYWQDRRKLPKLRVLAFTPDSDEPEALKSELTDTHVRIDPVEGAYLYRITLPEWMVEPGS